MADTSFLLPAMGVEVEREVIKAIEHFREVEVCYIEACMLEALWKILRVVPLEKIKRVEEGINAIISTYKLINPPPEAYINACELYYYGHRDYIDNLLYATSRELDIPLLTIDRAFIKFLKKKGFSTDNVMTPDKFP